jgi:hypothetical protein
MTWKGRGKMNVKKDKKERVVLPRAVNGYWDIGVVTPLGVERIEATPDERRAKDIVRQLWARGESVTIR